MARKAESEPTSTDGEAVARRPEPELATNSWFLVKDREREVEEVKPGKDRRVHSGTRQLRE